MPNEKNNHPLLAVNVINGLWPHACSTSLWISPTFGHPLSGAALVSPNSNARVYYGPLCQPDCDPFCHSDPAADSNPFTYLDSSAHSDSRPYHRKITGAGI